MPQSDPGSLRKRLDEVSAARGEARRAAIRLARDRGVELHTRPVWRGAESQVQDVPPLDGAWAARDIELGARFAVSGYIRAAREAGHTWQEIGQVLDLVPNGDAQQAGETVAEAAYTYAAGQPDPETPWRPRSFSWTCQSCEQLISDFGPENGPDDDERGHAQSCARLAAEIAAWEANWEAEP